MAKKMYVLLKENEYEKRNKECRKLKGSTDYYKRQDLVLKYTNCNSFNLCNNIL